MQTVPVAIGLGANLGDPITQVQAAAVQLTRCPGLDSVQVSPLYGSRPVGPVSQPDFVNAVCIAETSLSPDALLGALAAMEDNAGRSRIIPQGPRVLDLDLLLYGEEIVQTPALEVPHPRMSERGFVLAPLARMAPDWRHPVLARTIAELLSSWEERATAGEVWILGEP